MPGPVIRILLAEFPRWQADLVREAIENQKDMDVVNQPVAYGPQDKIDIIVISLAPHVSLIAIGNDGRMLLYDRKAVREAAYEQLVPIIRQIAREQTNVRSAGTE